MPSCSKQKNPRGIYITFDEDTHKYWSIIDNKEIDYISGTTFVHKFFPKFDPTGDIARRCAIKEGLTVEAIRKKWDDKRDASSRFGTKIHETMEDVLQGNMLRNKPQNEKERLTMEKATKLAKLILERADILGIEKIVFDSDVKIAGTIDLLARSKRNGQIWILDHKTNDKIEVENKWHSYALEPISHMANTNYCQYTLQLNLYENIMKRAGYLDKNEHVEKALFHITERGNKTYVLKSYQKEINDMIAYLQT